MFRIWSVNYKGCVWCQGDVWPSRYKIVIIHQFK